MLITLIAELIRDEHKQRAFVKDPAAHAASAGLTDEEQTALASRDPEVIARHLARELSVVAVPTWGAPRMHITPPVHPAQGSAGERIGNLTIKGEWFAGAQRMEAQLEGGSLAEPVRVQVLSVTNVMMPESVLVGSFELPADAQPGSCTVRLTRLLEDPPSTDTFPGAFTIVAR